MVVTVRNSFAGNNGYSGVGFGAKPLPWSGTTMRHTQCERGHLISSQGGNSSGTMASPVKWTSSKTLPKCEPEKKTSGGGFNKVLTIKKMPQISYAHNSLLGNLPIVPPSPPKRVTKRPRKTMAKENRAPATIVKVVSAASHQISEHAHKLMDDLEERHRKQTSKERIAQCLVNLRAASERSLSLKEFQLEEQPVSREPSLRDIVGSDIGVTLFNPLSLDAFNPIGPKPNVSATQDDELMKDEEPYPVTLDSEPQSVLTACPRLLSRTMLQQLVDALPPTVKTMTWKRLFSLERDGDSFYTMLDHVQSFTNTIVVIQTSWGHILGGYAASPWDKQGGLSRSFFGSGQAFLFATDPDGVDPSCPDDEDCNEDKLHIYHWTGNNNYCQVCDVDDGQIAMGGGGSFGLIVQDNFTRGSTGCCSTFGNPALIPLRNRRGGTFDIVAFEVYGFTSMAETHAPKMTEDIPILVSLLRGEDESPLS